MLSEHGIRQLHAAETEKYAHVTYFLDGGREAALRRARSGSSSTRPRDVPSYDHKPRDVGGRGGRQGRRGDRRRRPWLRRRQLREPGHGRPHGRHPRRRQGGGDDRRVPRPGRRRGRARRRRLPRSSPTTGTPRSSSRTTASVPHTAHTTNPVPAILTAPGFELRDGELSEVAPTILAFSASAKSSQMT